MKPTTLLLIAAISAAAFISTQPAECAICSLAPCFNSMSCLQGCACLKSGLDTMGTCVSLNSMPE